MKLLILSDGRMGHLNQSIAFAKYLGYSYDVVEIKFKNRFAKVLSYLFDKIGIMSQTLFIANILKSYDVVVGTGSSTYYATKVLAKSLKAGKPLYLFTEYYSKFGKQQSSTLKKSSMEIEKYVENGEAREVVFIEFFKNDVIGEGV